MSSEVNNNDDSQDGSSQDGSLSDAPPPLTNQFHDMTNEQPKQEPVSPPPMDKRTMYEEEDESVASPVVIGELEKEDQDDEYEHSSPRLSNTVLAGHYDRSDKNDYKSPNDLNSYFEYDNSMDRLEVECGPNKAYLSIDKLCQGSKGKCIEFKGHILTPNEFQSISGRETAKDWKRSIRHQGKSLKTLMARGLLKAHPVLCECHSCKSGARGLIKLKREKKDLSNQTHSSRHQLDDMSIDSFREYSSVLTANRKRARSSSPMDDIYDEEQRKLFEMANSPEPKSIESLQRSLAADGHAGSPAENITTSDKNHNETMSSSSSTLQTVHYTVTKPGKNRKQTAPMHLDVKKESKEKVPHIALTHFSSSHQPMKLRYQQASQSLTIPPGPSSAGEGSVTSKRARSLFTPTLKSPHVRMIELTRPAQSSTDKIGTQTSLANGDDASYRQLASSTSDTVFLPSDMANWSVDDVAEFVRSLRGCEDYSQVFREQAIDGEILPVLTEEHLLHNMGLKLGPALKIKINVAKRIGYSFIDDMQ